MTHSNTRPPATRHGRTHKVSVAGTTGYVTVNRTRDGRIMEVFGKADNGAQGHLDMACRLDLAHVAGARGRGHGDPAPAERPHPAVRRAGAGVVDLRRDRARSGSGARDAVLTRCTVREKVRTMSTAMTPHDQSSLACDARRGSPAARAQCPRRLSLRVTRRAPLAGLESNDTLHGSSEAAAEGDTVKAMVGHCGIRRVREPDDMISGHLEYETQTLCGEATCSDECWQSWAFCPYCGKPFDAPKQAEPLVIGMPNAAADLRRKENDGHEEKRR